MRAIMYHYVREYDPKSPNFLFLNVESFVGQLDYFQREYGFVDRVEWDAFVDSGIPPRQPGKVLLTFDDAMRCHYDYVFPELKKRGLWGIFYVPTKPYVDREVLAVHRVHHLLGGSVGGDLFEKASKVLDAGCIDVSRSQEFEAFTYTRQANTSGVSEFKRLLNYFCLPERLPEVLGELEDIFGVRPTADSYYVREDELREMTRAGMVVGSHSHSHPVMSRLSFEDQYDEIKLSLQTLANILPQSRIDSYCHPYGGFHSFNDDTLRALSLCSQVKYSFNVESRCIKALDYEESLQYLPRFDCNQFPYGQVDRRSANTV